MGERERRLIALKSPIQKQVDTRPRCQDCGAVLVHSDYTSYWDGPDPWPNGCLGRDDNPTPRCCEFCASDEGAALVKKG